jgi:integrase/recombinase XerD
LATLQRIIGHLPFKRGARDAPIEYLERGEMDALLKSINRRTSLGRRDYALFALMFNTGARVQEVLNLRRRDLRLDAPYQVRLTGKGNKVRLCPLTRYGVRYLLRKYAAMATRLSPTLRGKSLHPHSIRHSTAVALLKAGVDFATISQWLGHAGLNTTMRYARADLDLKRQALSQVFPDALAPPRGGRLLIDGSDLVGWLRRM